MNAVFDPTLLKNYNFDFFQAPVAQYSSKVFNSQTSGIYIFGGQNQKGNYKNDL